MPTAISDAEARTWKAAERDHWEADPCTCLECLEAGVTDKPRRFVPLDPYDRAQIGDRDIYRGEWIHGWTLKRWYKARDDFSALWHRLFPA
jgi:hypothetical protein